MRAGNRGLLDASCVKSTYLAGLDQSAGTKRGGEGDASSSDGSVGVFGRSSSSWGSVVKDCPSGV